MRKIKGTIIISAVGLIIIALFAFWMNWKVNNSTDKYVFNNIDDIPSNRVGLLLGTTKHLRSGSANSYFDNRISAAVELYRAGKIQKILISGDHSKKDYNEPQDMKDDLIKAGIPAEDIYLDYAGLRTFDSIFRAKEIFGQNNFTVISQEFHNKRAIYIAQSLDLDAYGYNAKDVKAMGGFKTKLREFFARVKVFLDIATNKKPKYLGDKIEII